jgi:hypothetical protein
LIQHNEVDGNQPMKWAKEADARGYPGTAIMKAALQSCTPT